MMEAELKIPQNAQFLEYDVLTDINVYPFPAELESCNFQDQFLLCLNQ